MRYPTLYFLIYVALVIIVFVVFDFRPAIGMSMYPIIQPGDFILVNPFVDPKPGDIVVYQTQDGKLVAHKVLAVTKQGLIVEGTNNFLPDVSRNTIYIPRNKIEGVVALVLPAPLGWTIISLFALAPIFLFVPFRRLVITAVVLLLLVLAGLYLFTVFTYQPLYEVKPIENPIKDMLINDTGLVLIFNYPVEEIDTWLETPINKYHLENPVIENNVVVYNITPYKLITENYTIRFSVSLRIGFSTLIFNHTYYGSIWGVLRKNNIIVNANDFTVPINIYVNGTKITLLLPPDNTIMLNTTAKVTYTLADGEHVPREI